LGKWHKPVEINEARSLLQKGAILVDVRSPNEFASDALSGSVNLPLEELQHNIEKFKQATCLLFCNSGTRSHIAQQKLKSLGIDCNVYNVGALQRARELV
jgi:phage shock protein E